MTDASRDQNHVPTALGVSSVDGTTPVPFRVDPVTGRLLTDITGGGSGTVTSVSVVTANGFAGTVANATTTPAITLTTSINAPVLAGNGTAISAATTTGSGSTVVLATGPTLTTPVIGAATGTSLTVTGLLQSTSLLLEDPGAGSNTVTLQAPSGLGASYTLTLPVDDGASGEVLSTNGSGTLSWVSAGGVPTTITVANEAADTTCFIGLFTAATGDLGPKTNANLTFNASTGVLTAAQTISGSITGNAATVTTANEAADTTCFITFATAASGSLDQKTNANMTFNASTGVATFASTVLTTTDINGGTIDGTTIGGASAAAGTFTTHTSNNLLAASNDVGAIGASGTAWSDLFLASGGVINWAAGNVTITHAAASLTVAGATTVSLGTSAAFTTGTIELGAASDTTISRVSAGLIAVEGNEVVVANRTATRTMVLTGAGGWPSTTSGASANTKVEFTTNDQDLYFMDFDQTTAEYSQWTVVMPDSYTGGTITASFYWTANSTSTNSVVWGIQGRAYADGDAIDATWGTAQTVTDANGASAYTVRISAATSAVTLAGSPAGGQLVQFRAYRDAASGSDTLAADARLIAVKIEYPINSYTD